MKDKVEAVLNRVKETWGPLPVRKVDDALSCIVAALNNSIQDNHVKHAIYALIMRGLEKETIEGEFVDNKTIEDILKTHIEKETCLYLFSGYVFHPSDEFENPDASVEEKYCKHQFMQGKKALYDEFNDAYQEAHELLCGIIDRLPAQMTNCELEIDMVNDGELIDMGTWTWDRLSSVTTFRKPVRQ